MEMGLGIRRKNQVFNRYGSEQFNPDSIGVNKIRPSNMKTTLVKTYEMLKAAGSQGIHSFELMRLAGTTRVAARVRDLKKQGHCIRSFHEALRGVEGCRYILDRDNFNEIKTKKPMYTFDSSKQVFIQYV